MRPIVLSIAGFDPSSGAGVQADLKTIEANGGYAVTAVTAITIQNTRGVLRSSCLAADLVRDQLRGLSGDCRIGAVKSGMLASAAVVRAVADWLRDEGPEHYVLDPVIRSSTGVELLPEAAIEAMKRELLPRTTLLTANVEDALALTGLHVGNVEEAEAAGRRLLEQGCPAALLKGGHFGRRQAVDVLVTRERVRRFSAPRLEARHSHGTGCVLSAAIATALAQGEPLEQAVDAAKRFVTDALRHGLPLGGGVGPTDPMFRLARSEPAGQR